MREEELQICKSKCPSEFHPIIELFEEDCNGHISELRTQFNRLFIAGYYREENCELMLRYGENKPLIVAKVQFIHRRAGKMTELYRLLKEIQENNETGKIEIQSVISQEMGNWCMKNGFIKKLDTSSYVQPDSEKKE